MTKVKEVLQIIEPMTNVTKPRSNSKNRGKIRKDLTSFHLLSEAYLALSELDAVLDINKKISADLLVRYIFEIEVDFFYLFKVNKGKQNLCDAYIYFGNLHQSLVIKNGDSKPHKAKWLEALGVGKVESNNHWSGLSRKKLLHAIHGEETKLGVLYKIFSGFTHPGIFTLERTLENQSKIYSRYSEINLEFPAFLVGEMFNFALENGLYGVNKTNLAKNKLQQFLNTPPPSFVKKQ